MSILSSKTLSSWLTISFFIIVVIASIADISADLRQGSSLVHITQEAIILLLAIFILIRLYADSLKHRQQNIALKTRIATMDIQYAQVSEELLKAKKEFGEVIRKQFSDWKLTESEADVAWQVLKGLNSKETARIKNISEKTVRNQLSSVYKKSGLKGKQHLIAWFMDDLI